MDTILSVNKVPIRLTDERWLHISRNHEDVFGYYNEILETITKPDYVVVAYRKSLMAIKKYGKHKVLCVIYKELSRTDGFIVTSYFTKKIALKEKNIVWQKK